MGVSVYTYTYNVLSQGYPFLEAICSLLPIADEVIIVDVGSKDGTRELLRTIEGRKVKVFDEEPWVNGKGGSNHRKTGSKCHDYCTYNTIAFVEADEVWQPKLVEAVREELYNGNRNLKLWRYQVTQNFQRVFWYPEKSQLVHRIFPRGSSIMLDDGTDIFIQESECAKKAKLVSNDHGYIVDCRNNHRDHYLNRENIAKDVWAEQSRKTTRMAPAHAAYSWELNEEQLRAELADERWLWKNTILDIPPLLRPHLGEPTYKPNEFLLDSLRHW